MNTENKTDSLASLPAFNDIQNIIKYTLYNISKQILPIYFTYLSANTYIINTGL